MLTTYCRFCWRTCYTCWMGSKSSKSWRTDICRSSWSLWYYSDGLWSWGWCDCMVSGGFISFWICRSSSWNRTFPSSLTRKWSTFDWSCRSYCRQSSYPFWVEDTPLRGLRLHECEWRYSTEISISWSSTFDNVRQDCLSCNDESFHSKLVYWSRFYRSTDANFYSIFARMSERLSDSFADSSWKILCTSTSSTAV